MAKRASEIPTERLEEEVQPDETRADVEMWEMLTESVQQRRVSEDTMVAILEQEALDAEEKHSEDWVRMDNGVD